MGDLDTNTLTSKDFMTNMFKMDKLVKIVSYNCRGFPKMPAKLNVKPTVNLLLNDESIDTICNARNLFKQTGPRLFKCYS